MKNYYEVLYRIAERISGHDYEKIISLNGKYLKMMENHVLEYLNCSQERKEIIEKLRKTINEANQ